jgi:hypothetical protein
VRSQRASFGTASPFSLTLGQPATNASVSWSLPVASRRKLGRSSTFDWDACAAKSSALLAGWAVGLFGGTYLAWSDGLKPLHALTFGDISVTAYVGLIAFAANVVTAVLVNLVTTRLPRHDHPSSI